MRRHLFYSLLILFLFSCGRTEEKKSPKSTVKTEHNSAVSKVPTVYQLTQVDKATGKAFISLSEVYDMSVDHPGISAIPKELLGNTKGIRHFNLTAVQREKFLKGTQILNSDSLFIYNYATNDLLAVAIKKLNVVAHVGPYLNSDEVPTDMDDFMIGFEVDGKLLEKFGDNVNNSFVCIDKQNPFVIGQIQAIKWEKIDSTAFPKSSAGVEDTTQYTRKDTYKYQRDNFVYFIQDASAAPEIYTRHLLIKDLIKNVIVREAVYNLDEGTSLTPLNGTESASIYNYQFTGQLFFNKPSVFFGLYEASYGCASIGFLKKGEADITIRCDNRH